jgi:hypothetical protein
MKTSLAMPSSDKRFRLGGIEGMADKILLLPSPSDNTCNLPATNGALPGLSRA